MTQVIQYTEKEDHIERAEGLGIEVVHTARKPCDFGSEIFSTNIESSKRPRNRVDGDHLSRSRRSASKEKNPSQQPTSRTRIPCISSGSPKYGSLSISGSDQPGVMRSGASLILWNQ